MRPLSSSMIRGLPCTWFPPVWWRVRLLLCCHKLSRGGLDDTGDVASAFAALGSGCAAHTNLVDAARTGVHERLDLGAGDKTTNADEHRRLTSLLPGIRRAERVTHPQARGSFR